MSQVSKSTSVTQSFNALLPPITTGESSFCSIVRTRASDCERAAPIGRDGSVDWFCRPRFDSDACFAALLGGAEHGRWLLAPSDRVGCVTQRRYRDDTFLETRFETADGAVLLIDFMPPRSGHSTSSALLSGSEDTYRCVQNWPSASATAPRCLGCIVRRMVPYIQASAARVHHTARVDANGSFEHLVGGRK